MGFQRKPEQTIVTRVTIDVYSTRPLPSNRVRAWLRHGLGWFAVSLHDTPAQPGDGREDEAGWEYVSIDVDSAEIGVVVVAEGWWHPNTNAGRVHEHPENPGGGWSVTNHRACEQVYTHRSRDEMGEFMRAHGHEAVEGSDVGYGPRVRND